MAQPNEKYGERRLVNITEGEMLTAGDVIELVAKISVTAIGEEMNEESHCAKQDDQFVLGCEPA